ncbi:zinc-dependent alcohol dehydrogenase [Congregibacter sp.]|uniref:zinc-dependent alcohol dehydrogenase n=1 Tax=Congregibacter sp. TaxID=2744308 RepID=UPI003F6B737E
MKAVVYQSNDRALSFEEVSSPEPGPQQLLVKVAACGICGSDLHAYQVGMLEPGMILGHEFSGEVLAIGEGVSTDWQVGDRVTALGALVCRECDACKRKDFLSCENPQLTGFSTPGAYAEEVLVSEALTVRVPEALNITDAALVEPMTVGLEAFRVAEVPLGGRVLVLGAGVIGLAVAKWARFFGAADIVVSDLDTERLDRALAGCATAVIDASVNQDAVQAFRDAVGAEPDVILECVGRPMLQQLIDIAPAGCHIVSVGVSMQDEPVSPLAAAQKKLRLTFSFGYGSDDFRFVARMLAEKRIPVDDLITQRVSLEEVPEIFEGLMKPNGHCKIVMQPGT